MEARGAGLIHRKSGPIDRDPSPERNLACGIGATTGLPTMTKDDLIDGFGCKHRPLERGDGYMSSEIGSRLTGESAAESTDWRPGGCGQYDRWPVLCGHDGWSFSSGCACGAVGET